MLNIYSLSKLLSRFFFAEEYIKPLTDEAMLAEAHEAIIQADFLFTKVDEEEMIDYAIYTINAAEKRYNFLLKKIKALSE